MYWNENCKKTSVTALSTATMAEQEKALIPDLKLSQFDFDQPLTQDSEVSTLIIC